MVLGRTRQLNRSQIDALIRYPGFQVEAVDTGYLRETENPWTFTHQGAANTSSTKSSNSQDEELIAVRG